MRKKTSKGTASHLVTVFSSLNAEFFDVNCARNETLDHHAGGPVVTDDVARRDLKEGSSSGLVGLDLPPSNSHHQDDYTP